MRKTVGDLTPRDLGKTVTVELPHGGAMRGMLTGLQAEVDRVEMTSLASLGVEDTAIPGRRTVRVTVGWWESPSVALDTAVEMESA